VGGLQGGVAGVSGSTGVREADVRGVGFLFLLRGGGTWRICELRIWANDFGMVDFQGDANGIRAIATESVL
jgi:hypothetical protein